MTSKEDRAELDKAAEYEQRAVEDFSRLFRYAKKEPALLLTGLYFVLSFAGLLHLYLLMNNFNVNVLPHLELTDFLLGAVYFPKNVFVLRRIDSGGGDIFFSGSLVS